MMTNGRASLFRPSRSVTTIIAVALVLGVAALIRIPTLAFPLTEVHHWRQTQTAFTAVIFSKEGIDLLNPQIPVLGESFVVPFEFPLYQAASALLMQAGFSAEVALRGVSLLSFIAAAGVLWILLRRHVNERTALIALILFLFSPYALLWSRTSMIEYPAALGALLFMLGTLEWYRGGGRRWFVLALLGGSAAALVKITTAVFWVAPALFTRRILALVLCGVPAVAGLAWARFADFQKIDHPIASALTSGNLMEWNFGGDRLSPELWSSALWPLVVPASLMLLPLALFVIKRGERLVWAWFAVALLGPILTFFHLYAEHDYYTAAVTPAAAALTAGGLDWLLSHFPRPRVIATLVVVTALLFATTTVSYWSRAYTGPDHAQILARAEILRAASPGGEYVELGCSDWDPSVMFYAERKGTALVADGTYLRIDDPAVCLTGKAVPAPSS